MRTMKLWRLAIIMLAAFSLVSCSNDDDDKLNINLLAGKWKRVYDEGVVSEGYVYYIFTLYLHPWRNARQRRLRHSVE